MKEIEKVAANLEAKLNELESAREKLAEEIRVKKQQIAQLEAAGEKLRNVQKQFGG